MKLALLSALLLAFVVSNNVAVAFAPGAKSSRLVSDAFVPSSRSSHNSLRKCGHNSPILYMADVQETSVDNISEEKVEDDPSKEALMYNEASVDSLSVTSTIPDVAPIGELDLEMSFEQRRSEGAITSDEVSKDPLGFLVKEVKAMDINSIVNTGIVLAVTIAVLSKLATVDAGLMRGWTAAEMAARIPVDNWNSYSAVLENSPVSTKAFTSATVYTIGDIIAQRTEGATIGELDRPRIVRSLLAGLIGHGPLSHIWYDKSETLFSDVLEWTEWWSVFPKVVLDQMTWGPFWNNVYIVMLGAMKLQNPTVIWEDVKRTTIPLVVSGLKLWPLAHCVTYGLVPLENRLLWVDFVEIIWVTILATQAAGGGSAADGHGASSSTEEEVKVATEKP